MFQLANLVVAADPFVTVFEKRGNLEQKFIFKLCILHKILPYVGSKVNLYYYSEIN